MATITASEFQKRVAEFSDIARREPVTVTRRGRAFLVLLAAEDYDRLKRIEQRTTWAVRATELPPEIVEAIRSADLSHLPD